MPSGVPSALRPVLGLLHGDLVDVRKRPRATGAFDGLDGDILDLRTNVLAAWLDDVLADVGSNGKKRATTKTKATAAV